MNIGCDTRRPRFSYKETLFDGDRIVCNSAAQQGSNLLEPAGASVRIRESVFELQQQSSITSIASPMMFINSSITQPIVPGVRPGVMNKDLRWSWDPSNLSDLSEPHPATLVHREGLRPFVNFSPSVGPNYASDTRTEYVRPHGTQRRKHQSHSRVNPEYKRHVTNNQRIIPTDHPNSTQLISASSAHHTPHLRNLFPARSRR
ncbi:uncharacterized protein DEA37_0007046 [Paragonimus westermani]|uniref:Uncharacterized protein n=1 Tax=Paragonimus westermani TaxID=34504 RepID=A0A5J4NZH3_9TREM|nr:uncharacterized protein DEA37_0007046 [Paragonimus westermani]